MSHTVTIKAQFKDITAIREAAKELGLPEVVEGTAKLFSTTHQGAIVKLKGWMYPVVIDTKTGTAHFDNYNGNWGKQVELDRFTQLYAVHRATAAAKAKGLLTTRKVLATGAIQVVVTGY